jgi:hypothetical protein
MRKERGTGAYLIRLVAPDFQTTQDLQRVEIPVAVKKRMAMFDAVTGQQHIHGAAHRVAMTAQNSIMLGGGDGVPLATNLKHRQGRERLAGGDKILLIAKAAQYFEQHQIRHRQWRRAITEQIGKSLDARIIAAVEEVYPDGSVDQDHFF